MASDSEYVTTNCKSIALTDYLKSKQLITNVTVWLNGRRIFLFIHFC